MSFEAMTWAANQKCGSSGAKLVLLMLADHANGHSGQCNPRIKRIAEICEMSESCVKNHIKNLESIGVLRVEARFVDGVQVSNQYWLNCCSEKKWVGQNLTGGGSESDGGVGQNLTPVNQEVKNQEVNHPQPPTARDARFDAFWDAYPKKVGKDAALRAWKKIKQPSEVLSDILEALRWQKSSEQWVRDNGQYIPNPATYLNQGRWKDENPSATSSLAQRSIFAGMI